MNIIIIISHLLYDDIKIKCYFLALPRPYSSAKLIKNILKIVENHHLNALKVSLKVVGEKSLLTAKSYYNLGQLYIIQENFMVIIIL